MSRTNFSIVTAGIALALAFLAFKWYNSDSVCDLSIAENRDFYRYFGISNIGIFKTSSEDHDDIPMYEPFINDAMKTRSVIVLGARGSGKTKLRQYLLSKLKENEFSVIKLYGDKINAYLDNFAAIHNEDKVQLISKYWNQTDYLHIILSEIVTKIVSEYKETNLMENISPDNNLRIAALLSYYAMDMPDGLIKIVNRLLRSYFKKINHHCIGGLLWESFDKCDIRLESISIEKENKVRNIHEYKEDYIRISKLYSKRKTRLLANIDNSPKLLFGIAESTDINFIIGILENGEIAQIKLLADFYSTNFKKKPVIVIDSLDENIYFFNESSINLGALQAFVNSAIHTETLALSLGDAKTAAFYSLIFLPDVEGLTVKWERVDKIPIVKIQWNPEKLRNYADFLFGYLAKNRSGGCMTVPKIDKLINVTNINNLFSSLRHPRDLHIFLSHLITQMNTVAKDKHFLADHQDVDAAKKSAESQFLKGN